MVTISVPSGTSGSGSAEPAAAWRSRLSPAQCSASSAFAGGADFAAFCCRAGCGRVGAAAASAVLERGFVLALGEDHGDRRIDRDIVGAFRHQNFAERAVVDRLDLHGRLVGLDLGDDIAGLDGVALLLEPLGEVALLHGRRQRGHEDLNRHGGLTRQSSRPSGNAGAGCTSMIAFTGRRPCRAPRDRARHRWSQTRPLR